MNPYPLLLTVSLASCVPAPGQPGPTDIAVYEREQLTCVEQSSSRAEVDLCRHADRADWCAHWPAAINCVVDGGSQ